MITYRASARVEDMHRVVSLARAEGQRAPRLVWPVVVAEDGRHLVAAIGTSVKHGLVVAGPVLLQRHLGRRAWTIAYRMGRLYDRAMAAAGVRAYYVYVEPALTQWQYVLERLDYVPVASRAPGQWYRRTAGEPWGQVLDSSHAEPVDGLRQRLQATR
jgi:hypothetical protein